MAPRAEPARPNLRQLLRQGRAAFEAGDFAAAEPLLRRVAARSGRYANVFHMLGVMASHRGDAPQAIQLFRQALHVNPGYHEAQLNLAIILADTGAYDQAAAEAEALQVRAGEAGADLGLLGQLANAHAELARRYHALGFFRQALREYDEALELCPGFPDLHAQRAASLRALGDEGQAEAALRRALELKPDYVEAHVRLGLLLQATGRGPEAVAAWERALALDAGHAAARVYLRAAGGGAPAR
jgi:tetratricopeptide (TPR) repeat protein